MNVKRSSVDRHTALLINVKNSLAVHSAVRIEYYSYSMEALTIVWFKTGQLITVMVLLTRLSSEYNVLDVASTTLTDRRTADCHCRLDYWQNTNSYTYQTLHYSMEDLIIVTKQSSADFNTGHCKFNIYKIIHRVESSRYIKHYTYFMEALKIVTKL